jgi:hypothetical protein
MDEHQVVHCPMMMRWKRALAELLPVRRKLCFTRTNIRNLGKTEGFA